MDLDLLKGMAQGLFQYGRYSYYGSSFYLGIYNR